jgi:L-lactate dehydrogenase complex protein LldF
MSGEVSDPAVEANLSGDAEGGAKLLFPPLPYDMTRRIALAAANEQLQAFVSRATLLKHQDRKSTCVGTFGVEGYDAVRRLAGQIKQHTLDHLDYYLEQFVDAATAAGAQVHFATDAAQANAICIDIARRNDCKLCVKSKSMVTEETHLVPALEKIGCETIETDLGEFIIQLDHDAPSHIVTPMIHKDRTAVARAFQRELDAPYTEDPTELTKIARSFLRDKFKQADLGISGANFLVAERGTLVICTNEGNGRLCTSVPKVHVAFVGIEKLVPSLEHLGVMLKVLARSSTGQPLTIYTHLMTGPKRPEERDGPEQVHIVLIDNGRSKILSDPETREVLRCIRCGACLNSCPVYRKIGGHAYGAVYSGPIGALITPMFKGLENYKDLPQASSLCGACYEVCPVRIDIPRMLIKLRQQMVTGGLTRRSDRIMMRLWTMALRSKLTYRLSGWGQRLMFRTAARLNGSLRPGSGADPYDARGWVRKFPGPVGRWTEQRDLPTPPAHDFRHWWRQHQRQED